MEYHIVPELYDQWQGMGISAMEKNAVYLSLKSKSLLSVNSFAMSFFGVSFNFHMSNN